MDFAALVLALVLYYIRPQEWMLALQPYKPVTLVMLLAVVGVVMRTGLSWKQLIKTPHDWAVLAYCSWMVVASPDRGETFHSVYPLFIFYIVAVQALINLQRITRFLIVWTVMIFAVAALAILSLHGFDPTGAEDLTNYLFKGRLALGTSIFRNPNALGHSIVPAIMMIYFLFIWRRLIFVRIGSLPLFVVPLYCIYLTLSKGAFIAAFGTAVAALTFGRPKIVQALVLAFALTSGWAAMKTLPRMEEINSTKGDEAIQGRVAAFTFGYDILVRSYRGLGKDSFTQNMRQYTGISKASHSSYVQIGAELGRGGFFLFMAILYCCLRTLFTSKSRNDDEERVRRILFTMLISYLISSWMVDFAYRAAFFLCVGAIAAYHRLLLPTETVAEATNEAERYEPLPSLAVPGLRPVPVPAAATPMSQVATNSNYGSTDISIDDSSSVKTDVNPVGGIKWNRFQLIDLGLIIFMCWVAVKTWAYAIQKM